MVKKHEVGETIICDFIARPYYLIKSGKILYVIESTNDSMAIGMFERKFGLDKLVEQSLIRHDHEGYAFIKQW